MVEEIDKSGFTAPSRFALDEGIIKFDASMMQQRRRQVARMRNEGRYVCRYLNPDGSPQGRELFVCKLWETVDHEYEKTECTILPLTTLAHRHGGTHDRSMCMHHIAFLEAGPTVPGMQDWGASVFGIVGDLKEATLPESIDMSDVYVNGHSDDRLKAAAGTFFFPNALKVPGSARLTDCIIFNTLVKL